MDPQNSPILSAPSGSPPPAERAPGRPNSSWSVTSPPPLVASGVGGGTIQHEAEKKPASDRRRTPATSSPRSSSATSKQTSKPTPSNASCSSTSLRAWPVHSSQGLPEDTGGGPITSAAAAHRRPDVCIRGPSTCGWRGREPVKRVSRPFARGLDMDVGLRTCRTPSRPVPESDLAGWGLGLRLRHGHRPRQPRRKDEHTVLSRCGRGSSGARGNDFFAATRIPCSTERIEALEVQGKHVFAAPHRDVIMVTGSEDEAGPASHWQSRSPSRWPGPRPMSALLYIRTATGWAPYVPATGPARTVGTGVWPRPYDASLYQEQKQLLGQVVRGDRQGTCSWRPFNVYAREGEEAFTLGTLGKGRAHVASGDRVDRTHGHGAARGQPDARRVPEPRRARRGGLRASRGTCFPERCSDRGLPDPRRAPASSRLRHGPL